MELSSVTGAGLKPATTAHRWSHLSGMALALEALVRQRAEARCEYCHFPEALAEVPFQFDHIISNAIRCGRRF